VVVEMTAPAAIHKKGHRDANEAAILQVAERLGYLDFDKIIKDKISPQDVTGYYQKRHPKDGHDVTFHDRHGTFCVEIKNLEGHSPVAKLEPREEVLRDLCLEMNIDWFCVTNEQEMEYILLWRKA
jgi:hypothetical protein